MQSALRKAHECETCPGCGSACVRCVRSWVDGKHRHRKLTCKKCGCTWLTKQLIPKCDRGHFLRDSHKDIDRGYCGKCKGKRVACVRSRVVGKRKVIQLLCKSCGFEWRQVRPIAFVFAKKNGYTI